jgi:hypothetical protein
MEERGRDRSADRRTVVRPRLYEEQMSATDVAQSTGSGTSAVRPFEVSFPEAAISSSGELIEKQHCA